MHYRQPRTYRAVAINLLLDLVTIALMILSFCQGVWFVQHASQLLTNASVIHFMINAVCCGAIFVCNRNKQ